MPDDKLECFGYHGTHSQNVDSIKKNGYCFSGEKDWLGKGIYFFGDLYPLTDGFSEAKDWVIKVKHYNRWAVFKAKIVSDNYLDLLFDEGHKRTYRKLRKKLFSIHQKSGKECIEFEEWIVFKHLTEETKVDFIRKDVDASKNYRYSYIIDRYQVQICVREKDCIKENRLVDAWNWR